MVESRRRIPLLTIATSAPRRPSHAFTQSRSQDSEVRRMFTTTSDVGSVTQGPGVPDPGGGGGATTTGPDATPAPAICQNRGGGSWGGGGPAGGRGGVWMGVRRASSQG